VRGIRPNTKGAAADRTLCAKLGGARRLRGFARSASPPGSLELLARVFFAAPPTAGRTLREPQDCSTPRAPRLSREHAPWLSRENVPLSEMSSLCDLMYSVQK